jgi:DNA-binding HxlR family transcriptional regulator
MRSYEQLCGLARALDVVGDRWTLLIVRELLIRGECRYTDLQYGLPGIATNLLADRLRQLEEQGIVWREAAPPPVATTLFRLTPRGEALMPVLEALGRWGRPLLEDAAPGGVFRTHWLVLPLRIHLAGHAPDGPPVVIELRTGDQPITIDTASGEIDVRLGAAAQPDLVITGPPIVVLDVVAGRVDLETARVKGVQLDGDPAALERARPVSSQAPPGHGRRARGSALRT